MATTQTSSNDSTAPLPLDALNDVVAIVQQQELERLKYEGDLRLMTVSMQRIEHIVQRLSHFEKHRDSNEEEMEVPAEQKEAESSRNKTVTSAECADRLSSLSEQMASLLETVYSRKRPLIPSNHPRERSPSPRQDASTTAVPSRGLKSRESSLSPSGTATRSEKDVEDKKEAERKEDNSEALPPKDPAPSGVDANKKMIEKEEDEAETEEGPGAKTTNELVTESWAEVCSTFTFQQIGKLFYDDLFEKAPALKETLFDKTDMSMQPVVLIKTIDAAVKLLDKPDELVPVLIQLGERHAGYGAGEAHYAVVGEVFVGVLAGGLGDNFTHEVKAAWVEVYDLIQTKMLQGQNSEKGKEIAAARSER